MRSLEDHLSPQELASLPESLEALAAGGSDRQQMLLHLKACEACANLVQAHTVLRSLGTSTGPGANCPTQTEWLEFAAGLRPEGAVSFPAHAAGCAACAVVLREALSVMEPDLMQPSQLDEPVAGLASSTPEWQSALAARLRRTSMTAPTASVSGTSWTSAWAAFLSPLRVGFAVLLIALAIFGIKEHQYAESSLGQLRSAQADLQPLQQNLHEQQMLVAQLQSEPAASLAHEKGLAAFDLEPGLTRGAGTTKHLAVPSGAQFAEVNLHHLNIPDGMLREELFTADHQLKWSQELHPPDTSRKSGSVSLSIPAYPLTPDDYQIVVQSKSNSSTEEIASYSFRIGR